MPRTKGSKNKPKMVRDFVSQIAEKQSSIEALNTEIASITTNIDSLKAELKNKRAALKSVEKEVGKLKAKKAKEDQEAAEAAKKAEAETVLKKTLGKWNERRRNPCKTEITAKPTADKYELAYCGLFSEDNLYAASNRKYLGSLKCLINA